MRKGTTNQEILQMIEENRKKGIEPVPYIDPEFTHDLSNEELAELYKKEIAARKLYEEKRSRKRSEAQTPDTLSIKDQLLKLQQEGKIAPYRDPEDEYEDLYEKNYGKNSDRVTGITSATSVRQTAQPTTKGHTPT